MTADPKDMQKCLDAIKSPVPVVAATEQPETGQQVFATMLPHLKTRDEGKIG